MKGGPVMLADIFGPEGLIVIVCVIVVLLFGGTKLPKLARGLGSASHEFKKGLEEGDKDGALPAAGATGSNNLPGTSATPQALPNDTTTN
jgi:sec-independent protein translocase protein TatA